MGKLDNQCRISGGRWLRGPALVLLIAAAGCDFAVTNPGQVQDSDLNTRVAFTALVNGAGRQIANALASGTGGSMAFASGAAAREMHPGGQTGSFGIPPLLAVGYITPEEVGFEVDKMQAARWVAEEAVRRIRSVEKPDTFAVDSLNARALLYVGFVNRMLGEHQCETVIDGGAPQSYKIHFPRADSAFTEALRIAQTSKNTTYTQAALAGRAQIRIWEGDWAGAMADAAQVPKTFKWQLTYSNLNRDQVNSFFYAVDGNTFRNVTMWHTWYADNYDQFKDPRTAYKKAPDIKWPMTQYGVSDLGDGRGELGPVPFYQEQKYPSQTSPINLTSGREMQLILAEGKLRSGDAAGSLQLVNDLRKDVNVTARTQANTDEAWTNLKLEKLIELFMEGRAFGERRRWNGAGKDPAVPGPLPALLRMDDRRGKDTCFPISKQEHDTNPNVPKT